MTAAHRSLPLPTYVEVTNLKNGRSVIVKVNDRGPFHQGRIIDLSYVAAVKLGILGYGTGLVEVRAIDTSEPADRPVPLQKPETAQSVRQEKPLIYLQAGAFRVRKYAEQLRAEIETQQPGKVRIVEPGDKSTLYKVQVGPLQDAGEIKQVTRELKTMGITDSHPLIQ
jgi:rare lipoprotein A